MQVDQYYMAQAIRLARLGRYTTSPNPNVGCVLVRDGQIIGQGWHQKAGEGHAEVNALASVADANLIKGATAYVTLEPCSHQGRTPPCADTLVNAGISKVVIAMTDPNPLVSGRGIAKLEAAGVEVVVGVLTAEAKALNPGFISRMERQRPFVRCKMAMSLDGRTAMQSGESQWITGAAARTQVQRIRARSSAVVTGVGSVIYDDCSLTVRAEQLNLEQAAQIVARQPLRVVLDSQLRIPLTAKILKQVGETVVLFCQGNPEKEQALRAIGVTCVQLPSDEVGRVALPAVLDYLNQRECNEVLLETGATLAGAFVQAGLVDELILFIAPTLLGHSARGLFNLPGISRMADQRPLEILSSRVVGQDLMLTARFSGNQ